MHYMYIVHVSVLTTVHLYNTQFHQNVSRPLLHVVLHVHVHVHEPQVYIESPL